MTERKVIRDPIAEIQDRLRRVETRLVSFIEASGFASGATKCLWIPKCDGYSAPTVSIPSLDVRLKDIMETIPIGKGIVVVRIAVKGDLICYLDVASSD